MTPMSVKELNAETGWRVTCCEILLDQSHTDTLESFGNISITSKKGVCIFFGFTAFDNKKIEMDEIRIFTADNKEVCIYEEEGHDLFALAYEIADQTNWRKIAINSKYEKNTRKLKSVSFNRINEADLLFFAEQQKDFSNWVKTKILKEIEIQD